MSGAPAFPGAVAGGLRPPLAARLRPGTGRMEEHLRWGWAICRWGKRPRNRYNERFRRGARLQTARAAGGWPRDSAGVPR
jgi:hypothetical protein